MGPRVSDPRSAGLTINRFGSIILLYADKTELKMVTVEITLKLTVDLSNPKAAATWVEDVLEKNFQEEGEAVEVIRWVKVDRASSKKASVDPRDSLVKTVDIMDDR